MDYNERLNLAIKLANLEFLLTMLYVLHFRGQKDPVRASQDFEQQIIESEPTEFEVSLEATMLSTEHLSQFVQHVTAKLLKDQEK